MALKDPVAARAYQRAYYAKTHPRPTPYDHFKGITKSAVNGTKYCSKCDRWLTLDRFPIRSDRNHPRSHCRECKNTESRKYNKNPIGRNAKGRYKRSDQGRITTKQYYERHKNAIEQRIRKYREEFPDKYKARVLLKYAVDAGILTRLPCEVCGAKADGHHPDYSKPLEVRWLCRYHHMMEHHTNVQ